MNFSLDINKVMLLVRLQVCNKAMQMTLRFGNGQPHWPSFLFTSNVAATVNPQHVQALSEMAINDLRSQGAIR